MSTAGPRAADLPLPALVLHQGALDHNLAVMADYCRDHGLALAPHAKTTMMPFVLRRQLAAGAWGLTTATVEQARVARAAGAQRIIVANQVVEPADLRWLAGVDRPDPSTTAYCLVDSVAGVELMGRVLAGAGARAPVLLEVGLDGGRAGCRTAAEVEAVRQAVQRTPELRLAGVEGFEGYLIEVADDRERRAAVDVLVEWVAEVTRELARDGAFAESDEIIVSVGTSAFFDRVAAVAARPAALPRDARVVLRCGSYATHDAVYAGISPLRDALRPALELRAHVLSLPEPGLAIAGFGRRHAPDRPAPIPHTIVRADGHELPAGGIAIRHMHDHHAFLAVGPATELRVGDVLRLAVADSSATCAGWRTVPVIGGDGDVVAIADTAF